MLTKVFFVILIIFSGWLLYRNIKHNEAAFSKENLGRSIYVLGILALLLIAFVYLLVLLLK